MVYLQRPQIKKIKIKKEAKGKKLKNLFGNTATVTVSLLWAEQIYKSLSKSYPVETCKFCSFAAGITKSEFYPHCVAASKFSFVQ